MMRADITERWKQVGMFFQRSCSASDICVAGVAIQDRQSSTGSVVVSATLATTPLSLSTIKTKTKHRDGWRKSWRSRNTQGL